MRKTLLVLMLSSIAFVSKAQDSENGPNVIKLNPLGLIFGQFNVGYERALGESSSFLIAPQFGGFKFGGVKYSSAGATAQYRYYFSGYAPEGFYAAPNISYTSGSVKFDDGSGGENKTNFSSLAFGAMAGKQWIFDSHFVIDLGLGANYTKFTYDNKDGSFATLKGSGILPAISFSLGYNF